MWGEPRDFPITNDATWLACNCPERFFEFLGESMTDGERLLILTSLSRCLWFNSPFVSESVSWAMNRVELVAFGTVGGQAFHTALTTLRDSWNELVFEDDDVKIVTWTIYHLCYQIASWGVDRQDYDSLITSTVHTLHLLCMGGPKELVHRILPAPVAQAITGWQHYRPNPSSLRRELGMAVNYGILFMCHEVAANIIKDIYFNPFRTFSIDPLCLDEAMVHDACNMHTTGTFSGVQHLGERLEDHKCGDSDVLFHCSSEHPHHRGCWLIRAITGIRPLSSVPQA